MKILLVEDVLNVGVLGDQVQVKSGYARNYLIPQGKAILATSKKSKELQHRFQFYDKLRQAAIEKAQGKADALKLLTLEIKKKAGSGGRLFGSVTNKEIEGLLISKGYEIARRDILPHQPIKTIGAHSVTVKLHTSVTVDIEVKVIGDQADPQPSDVEAVPQEIPIDAEEITDTKAIPEAVEETKESSSEE